MREARRVGEHPELAVDRHGRAREGAGLHLVALHRADGHGREDVPGCDESREYREEAADSHGGRVSGGPPIAVGPARHVRGVSPSQVSRSLVPHDAVLPGSVPDVAEKGAKSAKFCRLHRTPAERLLLYAFNGRLARERTEHLAMGLGTECAHLMPGKLDGSVAECQQVDCAYADDW